MQYGQTIMQYGQTKRSSESDSCFERIPMFVYEKRYLEVVTQMVLQEIGSVLNIYHKVELKCQQDNQLAHKEK